MQLQFVKMNGAGNDFVMLDNRDLSLSLSGDQIARLCDRHRGVGADGLLLVEPATEGGDFKMRYYNADGGEAEMCGNGARCFGRFRATPPPSERDVRGRRRRRHARISAKAGSTPGSWSPARPVPP